MSKIQLSSLWLAIAAATLVAPGVAHAEETAQPHDRSNVRSTTQAEDPTQAGRKALPSTLQPHIQASVKPKVRLHPQPANVQESNLPAIEPAVEGHGRRTG